MPNDKVTIFDRISRGLEVGLRAAQFIPDLDLVEKQLDEMIGEGTLPTAGEIEGLTEELTDELKSTTPPRKRRSRQDIRGWKTDLAYATYFRYMQGFARRKDKIPDYGDIDRDEYLSTVWRSEPILAGAVYSMSAKMVSLKWTVTGRRNLAKRYAEILAYTGFQGGGFGWGGFSSSSAQDFYTTDRGIFWEVGRDGNPITGRMTELNYIDCLQCTLTGNAKRPMHYMSDMTGQSIRFKPGEFIHFASLNSGRERHLGIGFCATSRALKAAKLLLGLHNYDSEKLSNLPPEGVASVTGLTMIEFTDALELWQAARKADNSLTFPQVLWLIGSQPNAQVKVDFVGFSQVPESFDRKSVVTQYVNTLALDFGVDAREFWPVSSGALGTVGESEIQHMKARGKGPGEYITTTEREINHELPEGVDFQYDTQDMEEDSQAAAIAKGWVEAFMPLFEGEVLDKAQFMRLLADKQVIPDWMIEDERVIADDLGVEEKYSDDPVICIEWDGKLLKQVSGPSIDLSYHVVDRSPRLLEADTLKDDTIVRERHPVWESADAAIDFLKQAEATLTEEPKRNIRGKPIPKGEALKGTKVTQRTVDRELELWQKHPLLRHYLPEGKVRVQ